jgi:hypothetical protein
MERIELELDERTLARARQLAASRHSTIEGLITALIEQLDVVAAVDNPLLGMFAGEPEVIDQAVESSMQAREEHPLRQTSG